MDIRELQFTALNALITIFRIIIMIPIVGALLYISIEEMRKAWNGTSKIKKWLACCYLTTAMAILVRYFNFKKKWVQKFLDPRLRIPGGEECRGLSACPTG